MYCDGLLAHNTNNDTSLMKKHLHSCPKNPHNVDKKQRKIYTYQASMPSNTGASSHVNCDCEFDHEAIRLALTKMVIIDEPFSMDEQQGF